MSKITRIHKYIQAYIHLLKHKYTHICGHSHTYTWIHIYNPSVCIYTHTFLAFSLVNGCFTSRLFWLNFIKCILSSCIKSHLQFLLPLLLPAHSPTPDFLSSQLPSTFPFLFKNIQASYEYQWNIRGISSCYMTRQLPSLRLNKVLSNTCYFINIFILWILELIWGHNTF